jgi:sialate O-acetylesterase
MKKQLLLFIVISIISSVALGTVRLPAIIASNMVLQQQSTVNLWGWADPSEKIYVTTSWNNVTDSVTGTFNATFKIKIKTPAAGGPYTITIRGWNTIKLENIMIGEVWVCSGQSNMEMSNTAQIKEEMPNSKNDNIRLFHIPRATSQYPQENVQAKWDVCGPESLNGFSAVGYFFGKKLQQQLNVPIGLIETAWGGTPAEVWTPSDIIFGDPVMKEAASQLKETPWGPYVPGYIYNAMVFPITNFGIGGTIWYQGEANTGIGSTYEWTLSNMIGAWRKAFDKNFPFYYVQIAPFHYGLRYEGAVIMEQQSKLLKYPNTGMVVITDLVDDIEDIHPKNKYDVGIRLANLALVDNYKQNIPGARSPMYRSMEINKNKVTLSFDNAPNGFMTKEKAKPTEFYVAGADKVFVPADVKFKKDKIILFSKQVPVPVAVRFSFSNTAMSNVFSKEGLPLAPFRTDDWELEKVKDK